MILLLVATLTSITFTLAVNVLTLAIVFPFELDAFSLGTSFTSLQTWDSLSSYAHLNHRCGMHTSYSSDPLKFD
jgi:hypothetical protein